MKKLLKVFLLFMVILFMIEPPASAESLQDQLVPQDSSQKSVGEVQLKYNEYSQVNYKLDTWVDTNGDWMPWNWADGAGKQIYIALMEIINAVWNVNVLLANFTMKIVQEAFQLDFVSNIVDEIGQAVKNIAGFGPGGFMPKGLWPLLVTFVIGIVGAWATYVGMVKRETSRAWSGLLSSIIIFVFALGFFSNASIILKGINDWSGNLQGEILAVSSSVVNPGSSYSEQEGMATIRNQMFDLMVKKPYLLMQYGTTKVDESRVNALLKIDPIQNAQDRSDKSKEEVQIKKNKMMSIDGISQRAAFVPLLFLANTIIGVFLLIVSGSIILYQLIFLVLVLFAPVPLLMALVPRWQQTAFDWAMKVVHAQLMKIAIALLLTILFGVSAILYRATDTGNLGYLGMMLLQIICFVGVWAKRRELFNMVSTTVNNVQSSTGAALQGYKQKYREVKNVVGGSKNAAYLADGPGRIRNQPLAQRQKGKSRIDVLDKDQLAKRQQQIKVTKDGLKKAVGSAVLANRDDEEFQEGQERYKERSNIKNPTTPDRKPLKNRKAKIIKKGNIQSIEESHSTSESRGLASAPLVEQQTTKDASSVSAAPSKSQPEMSDEKLSERNKSERHSNLINQHSHEDQLSEQQANHLTENKLVNLSKNRETPQDITNREPLVTNTHERKIKNTVNRQSVTKIRLEQVIKTNDREKSSHQKRE